MKKLYILVIALILAVATIVPAGVVSAGSQIEVSGNFVLTTVGSVIDKTTGDVMTGWVQHVITYDGSFTGTALETTEFSFNLASGEFSSKGTQTFAGNLGDKVGTFTALVRHQGVAGGETKVDQIITFGQGGLCKLYGTLRFSIYDQGGGNYTGTYSGKVCFARGFMR